MIFYLLASLAYVASGAMTYQDAVTNIQKDLGKYARDSAGDICNRHHCCSLSSTESCPLESFKKDVTSLVYPGGETRCIFSTSSKFSFQLIPGDSDKLLFYFQGGGACWDEATTTKDTLCSTEATPLPHWGVFDRSQTANTFHSYTVVNVLYCSGDIHGGNVVRDYADSEGVPVKQKGLANAQSALDWVVSQQKSGALAAELSDVVVMGCSAGSIGAQLWATQVGSALQYKTMSVMPDSYAGVFPPGSQGPLVYGFGFCSSGFLSPELYQKCMSQEITLQDINMEFIAQKPKVPTTFVQSKTDIVQMSFYVAIGVTTPNASATINPEEFYNGVNSIFEEYNDNKNFLAYLVNGDMHCFTCDPLWYTADAMGPVDNGKSNTGLMLSEWANDFPLTTGNSQDTVCEGDRVSDAQLNALNDEIYCDAKLVPKTFTEY